MYGLSFEFSSLILSRCFCCPSALLHCIQQYFFLRLVLVIEQFVYRVNVYPDRIEVIFNFYPDKVKYIPKTENEGRADARSSLFVPDIMVAESSKDNK